MTQRSAVLGVSLLILSLAAPAWAEEARPAPPKAKDHEARHTSEDRDDKAQGDKHDKDRRHDRD